jgi:SpoVT / AbrB like domain.
MPEPDSEKIEIGRSEPLRVDKRGRVTIPSNIRERHGIQPDSDREIWIEVTIDSAEIMYDEEESD